jgi:hypothetical protein
VGKQRLVERTQEPKTHFELVETCPHSQHKYNEDFERIAAVE